MKPIDLEWIKRYVDSLLDAAQRFGPDSTMGLACMNRADCVIDLVDAWKQHGQETQAKTQAPKKAEFVKASAAFVRGGSLSTDEPDTFNDTDFVEIVDIKKRMYIQAVARWPGLTLAAKKAGASAMCADLWRKAGDPVFDAAWNRARRLAITRAQSELWRRGIEGYDKPVYHQGQLVGTERVFSDTAAIFMLKGEMPEVYRERFEHSGPSGGPIEVTNYSALSDDELRHRLDIVRNKPGEPVAATETNELSAAAVGLPDTPETLYAAELAKRVGSGSTNGGNGNGNGNG